MNKAALDRFLILRLPIILFVAVFAVTATYFVSSKYLLGVGYEPEQPVSYSHKLHVVELGIDCQYCHVGADKGRHAVIPAVNTCMDCHRYIESDSEAIKTLTAFYDSRQPILWQRIHHLPDHVYFSHSAHMNAGIDCGNCHGPVEKMDLLRQVKAFSMGDCLACHRDPQSQVLRIWGDSVAHASEIPIGPEHCSGCHR